MMMDLDGMASAADSAIMTRITEAVELQCDDKAEWVQLFTALREVGWMKEAFASAARTALGKCGDHDYTRKKTLSANIASGDLNAVEITGKMLLSVAEAFECNIDDIARARGKKKDKEPSKGDDDKKAKAEEKKSKRGGMDTLIGENSDDLSKEFIGALDKDDPLTEKEMSDSLEAHMHHEQERKMFAMLKKEKVGKLGPEWTGHNGWEFTKAFIERLARTMLQVNMKKHQGVMLDMGTFRRATDGGQWQSLARESAKDASTLMFQQRRIESNVRGGHRGGRGDGPRGDWRGGVGRGQYGRGEYVRGALGGRGYMARGGTQDALQEAQSIFLASADTAGQALRNPGNVTPAMRVKPCRRCNSVSHVETDNGGCKLPYYCYNCNKNAGHIATSCPEPQAKRGR